MPTVPDKHPPLTPRDDAKKLVSQVLKRVDLLIKQGDLQQALLETRRAKEIDARNVYALAFEERIVALLEQEEKRKQLESAELEAASRRQAEEAARRKREEEEIAARLREKARVEAQRRVAEAQQAAAAAAARPVPPAPVAPPTPAPPTVSTQPSQASILSQLKTQIQAFASYKQALREVWSDGAATAEEQQWLSILRETLHIGAADHARLEHEAQLDAYHAALQRSWVAGRINPENAGVLADLRKSFNITPEDNDRIEALFLSEVRAREKKQARIAVIDDDEKLLEVVCEILQDAEFATLPFRTSDEAYSYLRGGEAPDLILCDVNLETSTMGGFSFYEKIQWLDHLQEVPFIFLTGLTDEVLIRTGKELGVDDYLTKPVSDQTLLATIRGKLKRFRRLKDRHS